MKHKLITCNTQYKDKNIHIAIKFMHKSYLTYNRPNAP